MSYFEKINNLIEKGILVGPELLAHDEHEKIIDEMLQKHPETEILSEETIQAFVQEKKLEGQKQDKVQIIKSYNKPPKKRSFQDFVSIFNIRFDALSSILRNRQELQGITSISRVTGKNSNERVAIIGMVQEKSVTKNNNIIIKLEDKTGICTAIIRKDEKNKEIYDLATDIVLDEVIGITGNWLNTALFVDKIIFPDVPLNKELKKQKEEEYIIFLGDTHFGSKHFMQTEFDKFISWIRGEAGNDEQKKIAENTKYLILSGDIVEGVGIYPSQEEDLSILDITKQYEEAATQLKRIPERIKIITMSGNHDAGRLSEPQETPFKDMACAIWEMPNVTLVSNPAYVNIGKTKDFPGFDILLYHGGSLIYYSNNIPSIRDAGGQKRCDLIMKFLLQKRHLAPTHGSTLYLPDSEDDYLLIDLVPDMFVTGHIHRSSVSSYRTITNINASCWTETTEDQVKRGLEPLPARIPIINLKTREAKIMNFLTKKSKEKEEEYVKELAKIEKKEK